ncbi:MAG: hypothetical protein HQL59_13825, partial [Magnetococcales bacterium]|nr:hypothetical protein [Magnetococcales bacterium]
ILKVCLFQSDLGGHGGGRLVADLVRVHQLAGAHFVGLLEMGSYSVFPAEAAEVPREELATAMRWRLKDQLEYPVIEAVVDVFDQPAAGQAESSGKIYVVAARDSVVQECADIFHGAKLELTAIDITELALRNLVALLEDDREGVVVLFLGRNDGLLTVTRNGTLFIARRVEVGVNQVLASLEGKASASIEELAASPVVDSLALEVQRTLDYYESHFFQSPVSCLHLAPMEVTFRGLDEIFAEKLGMRVKKLPIRQILTFAQEVDEGDLARCLPAIGAALRVDG